MQYPKNRPYSAVKWYYCLIIHQKLMMCLEKWTFVEKCAINFWRLYNHYFIKIFEIGHLQPFFVNFFPKICIQNPLAHNFSSASPRSGHWGRGGENWSCPNIIYLHFASSPQHQFGGRGGKKYAGDEDAGEKLALCSFGK